MRLRTTARSRRSPRQGAVAWRQNTTTGAVRRPARLVAPEIEKRLPTGTRASGPFPVPGPPRWIAPRCSSAGPEVVGHALPPSPV